MARTIADTDALIDYLDGREPFSSSVRRLIADGDLVTSSVTCFEFLVGAGETKKGDARRQLIELLDVLPLDRIAATKASSLRRQLEGVGQMIGMGDYLIAGIALAQGLPLLSRNARHFEKVAGLQIALTE